MKGLELAQAQQDVRNECERCAGAVHIGHAGKLTCARQNQEQQVARLKESIGLAEAAVNVLVKPAEDAPKQEQKSYEAMKTKAEQGLRDATEQFQKDISIYHLEHADGTPDRFGDRECPTLLTWDKLEEAEDAKAADLPNVTTRVDQWLAERGVRRIA